MQHENQKRRGRPRPESVSQPDQPFTIKLADGRTIYIEIPGHWVSRQGDELLLRPAAVRFLDQIRALATKIEGAPRPSHITSLREAFGMTQEAFGEAIGVNKLTVSRWERGELTPGQESLSRLRALQASASTRGVVVQGGLIPRVKERQTRDRS